MDSDAFAQLTTAIIDLTGASTQEIMLHNQQTFGLPSSEYSNKPNTSKPELTVHLANTFPTNNVNATGFYHPNFLSVPLSNNEQVPMDDFDPLESFTFWDGETFYCNPELDSSCIAASSNMPAEEEMAELQGYLLHNETMTKDDLPQIEETDLVRNPTLAELNSGRETVFDCSAENSFLSDDSGYLLSPELMSKSMPINEGNYVPLSSMFVPNNSICNTNANFISGNFPDSKNVSQSFLSSSCPVSSRIPPFPQYVNTYDERLMLCPQNSPSDSFVPKRENFSTENLLSSSMQNFSKSMVSNKCITKSSLLSTSAPPEVSMAIRSPHIKTESPSSSLGVKHTPPERSLSGFSSLSLSNDEESGSYFDDSEHDLDDFSSDEDLYQFDEADDNFSPSWPSSSKESKSQQRKHRYFWQYNLQARGIKTQNLLPLSEECCDPYKLDDVKDPVFSETCSLPVKHSGKARKGDGNDLTPNPRKLYSIGIELKKLNKLIYNLHPTSDLNVHGKPLSRKEKNKLASRVCRLKKKAQHEANKIKLYGLQKEHKQLIFVLYEMKRLIKYKLEHFSELKKNVSSFQELEKYLESQEPTKVAGNTTEFVNEVIEKISKGDPEGGLKELQKM